MVDKSHGSSFNLATAAQTAHVAGKFSHVFSRHLLTLQLGLNDNGTLIHETFTGFRLSVGADIWITAGHVIERIRELRRRFKLLGALLIDSCDTPGAEGIPVNLDDFTFEEAQAAGLDVGWSFIPDYYVNLLNANHDAEPLTERIWRGRLHAHPDAYYLVGVPQELTSWRSYSTAGRRNIFSEIGVACVPLKVLEPRDDPTDSFWSTPHSIFAEVLPLADCPRWEIKNIRGMSGGPVFGVKYAKGEMRYWLYGVQSSWLPDSRLIKATSIDPLAAAVEEILHRS